MARTSLLSTMKDELMRVLWSTLLVTLITAVSRLSSYLISNSFKIWRFFKYFINFRLQHIQEGETWKHWATIYSSGSAADCPGKTRRAACHQTRIPMKFMIRRRTTCWISILSWRNASKTKSHRVNYQNTIFTPNITFTSYKVLSWYSADNITNYMKYLVTLKFESRPDYAYLRSLFRQDMNFESLFGKRMSYANENHSPKDTYRRPNLRERKPCRPVNGEVRIFNFPTNTRIHCPMEKKTSKFHYLCEQVRITRNSHPMAEQEKKKESDFSWEAVLACHPDKMAKISAQPPSSPLTPPPSPTPPSIPTYAMLAVLQRMKDRQTGLIRHRTNSKSSEWVLLPIRLLCFFVCLLGELGW